MRSLAHAGALANQVEGNDIGTAEDGVGGSLPNAFFDIFIDTGAGDNTIGGAVAAAGNFINGSPGIVIP